MKTLTTIMGGLVILIGLILLSYFLWASFVPMQIGQTIVNRKVTQNSLQYVQTQKTALTTMYTKYTEATDQAQKKAIKGQMCLIMVNIPTEEVPSYIKGVIICN